MEKIIQHIEDDLMDDINRTIRLRNLVIVNFKNGSVVRISELKKKQHSEKKPIRPIPVARRLPQSLEILESTEPHQINECKVVLERLDDETVQQLLCGGKIAENDPSNVEAMNNGEIIEQLQIHIQELEHIHNETLHENNDLRSQLIVAQLELKERREQGAQQAQKLFQKGLFIDKLVTNVVKYDLVISESSDSNSEDSNDPNTQTQTQTVEDVLPEPYPEKQKVVFSVDTEGCVRMQMPVNVECNVPNAKVMF